MHYPYMHGHGLCTDMDLNLHQPAIDQDVARIGKCLVYSVHETVQPATGITALRAAPRSVRYAQGRNLPPKVLSAQEIRKFMGENTSCNII